MTEDFERRIAKAEKWYGVLLFILPSSFRAEHGREMVETFRDQALHELAIGGTRRARLYFLRASYHLLSCGIRERASGLCSSGARLLRLETGLGTHVDHLTWDVRFALRTLRKRPLFTAVAVLTLGVGIGAATTIYTIADSVLLQKLPYPELDRLVTVLTTRPDLRGDNSPDRRWDRRAMSYDQFRDWRDGTTLFDAVAAYEVEDLMVDISGGGKDERMWVGMATSSLMSVLGIQPTMGRWFLPGEDGPDAERLAVLGHSVWKERFDSDPGVVGSTVTIRDDEDIEGESYTIIGIAPPELRMRWSVDWRYPRDFGLWRTADVPEKDLWLPVGVDGQFGWSYEGIGRLRHGVSLEQAAAEVEPLIRGEASPGQLGVRVSPYSGVLTADLRSQLLLLSAPSALLLIIAFSNLAALLFGEVEGRRVELLTRMAVGASRGRLARQLLTESTILGLLGSVLGAFVAILGTQGLVAMAPSASPLQDVENFLPALLFACGVGVGGALLFGVFPAFLSEHRSGVSGGSRMSSHPGRGAQSRIVTLQVAFTVAMLVQAGLLTRTLLNLSRVDLGFDPENLAVVRFLLPDSYSKPEYVPYLDEILESVARVPGVEDVGLIQSLPFTVRGGTFAGQVQLEGRSLDEPQSVELRIVSPGYHEMMDIPLLTGRLLSRLDRSRDSRAAVVSETMARALWPDESPLGLRFGHMGRAYTVVGVVADVRDHGITESFVSIAYTPYAQRPTNYAYVIARLNGGFATAQPSIGAAIQSTSSSITMHTSTTMSQLVSTHTTDQRYHAILAVGFGIVAIFLAATGVFGIAARTVTRRSRDIAIRKALGATENSLVGRVVRSGFRQGLWGVLVGLTLAFVGSRFLVAFLFGVRPEDPLTYAVVGLLVVLICMLASFVPARRITAVDPVEVLKAE